MVTVARLRFTFVFARVGKRIVRDRSRRMHQPPSPTLPIDSYAAILTFCGKK
ncbi:hypothetical protein RSAG8_01408, partial [Rhizoctonia solani AG-8 WAC10335]